MTIEQLIQNFLDSTLMCDELADKRAKEVRKWETMRDKIVEFRANNDLPSPFVVGDRMVRIANHNDVHITTTPKEVNPDMIVEKKKPE